MPNFKFFCGNKNSIQNKEITNGAMYISTDSLQQFVDLNNQRIQLCDQNMDDVVLDKIDLIRQKIDQ